MEVLIQIFGEIILQAFGEALVELGLHSLAEPFRKPPNPYLAAFGYVLFGSIFGGISLLVLPDHLTSAGPIRIVNLIITPIVVGLCMVAIGAWRKRRGDTILRIDKFFYGYLFALSFALIRFQFAA